MNPSTISNPAPNLTILVNSSDMFEDCWRPFFTLFDDQWPECRYPILLNTETKDWRFPKLDLRTSKVAIGERQRLTWSECLIRAIDQVESPLLLYFQEDYFVDQKVRSDVIENAVAMMLAHPEVGHIALTKHGSWGPFEPSAYPGFSKIGQKAKYRISTQAALWRPEVLQSYLDTKENGWMFEIFGTRRAHRRKDVFLVADFDSDAGGPAIDYVHTGIIKGKWHPLMPELFRANNIDLDFSVRGFYEPAHPLLQKWDVAKKLLQNPLHAVRQLFQP